MATPEDAERALVGTVLLGKYRVDAVLGRGGMGLVVRAYHLGLGESVALKLLHTSDRESTVRLLREAQAAVRLKSEHVARVSDVGELDNATPYLVMELLEGADLGQMLAARGRLDVGMAVDFVIQACEALAEAHSLGIVHRDIKPTNLFVVERDHRASIKLLDFGISKSDTADLRLTTTQSMLGTPMYMSPEQMRSAHDVDLRTDVWSIGSVLYELVEGQPPFSAGSFSELVVKVSMDPPAPTRHLPPDLAAIVARCLDKSRDGRYQSMAPLAAALLPFAGDREASRFLVERIARRSGTAFAMSASDIVPITKPRRARVIVAVSIATTLVAAATFMIVWSQRDRDPDPTTSSTASPQAVDAAFARTAPVAAVPDAAIAVATPPDAAVSPDAAPPITAQKHQVPRKPPSEKPPATGSGATVAKPPATGSATVAKPPATGSGSAKPCKGGGAYTDMEGC